MTPHERFNLDNRAGLMDKAAELDVEIPFSDDIGALLQLTAVGDRRVPNRLAVQPMEACDAGADGAPSGMTFRRYRRYGAGGSGLIWFEATAVTGDGRAGPRQLWMNAGACDAFARLTDATRAAAHARLGNAHDPLLVLQLTHSGRYAKPDGRPRPVIAHHSEVLDPLIGLDQDSPLIADDELDRLLDRFVEAARLAAAAGFDAVDVKACNGYLVSELLAAHTRAGSRFGGSLENRTRFLLETIARIRNEVPHLILASRISAYDAIALPFGFGTGEGDPPAIDLSEPKILAGRLRDHGCALLNLSIGNPYHHPHFGRPFDRPGLAGALPVEHPLEGVARLLHITAEMQHAEPELPIVGTGYSWLRHLFPHVGAAAVGQGDAAFVGIGRCAFAYPDAAVDLMEEGRLDRRKTCLTCSRCTDIMRYGGCAGCAVRDAMVYAEEYRQARKRAKERSGNG